jgi:hypothetical protein
VQTTRIIHSTREGKRGNKIKCAPLGEERKSHKYDKIERKKKKMLVNQRRFIKKTAARQLYYVGSFI